MSPWACVNSEHLSPRPSEGGRGKCLKPPLWRCDPRSHGGGERWNWSVSLSHVPFLGHFLQQDSC